MNKQEVLSKKNIILSRFNKKLNSAVILFNVIITVGLVPALMGPINARADTVRWIGGSKTDWSNTANWSTGVVPGSSDDVTVNWQGVVSVQGGPMFDVSAVTLKSLIIGDAGISGEYLGARVSFRSTVPSTLTVQGKTTIHGGATSWLEVNQPTAKFVANDDITIGDYSIPIDSPSTLLSITNGGQLQVNNQAAIKLGTGYQAVGRVGLQNPGTYAKANDIVSGLVGIGTIQIATQAKLDSATVTLGSKSSGDGEGNVFQKGIWNVSGDFIVGDSGKGSALIATEGQLTLTDSSKSVIIASKAGSTGTLAIGAQQGDDPDQTGTLSGDIKFGAGTGKLLFNHTDTSHSFSSLISGSGALDHLNGTTRLTRANSYSGVTSIQGGTLYIDGDHSAASGAVTVANGAVLGGKGTIGGDVTVAEGGTLLSYVDGAEAVALTINGKLTASNAKLEYNFNSSTGAVVDNLEVNVKGNVDLTDAKINIIADSPLSQGKYYLIKYNSGMTGTGISLVDDNGGKYKLKITDGTDATDPSVVELISSVGATLHYWDAVNHANGKIDGGTGTWEAGGSLDNWTLDDGTTHGAFTDGSFAMFEGTAGTVTVDNTNGVINISGMQFSSGGYVLQNGTLTLGSGDNDFRVNSDLTAEIGTVLSGAGRLVTTGTGILKLTGANAYTGGTLIQAGTLNVVADNNLGAAAGAVEIDGGSLQFGAGLTSARAISVTKLTSTIDTENHNVSLTGVVSGTGTLNKEGTGTLTLTGTNTYSGGTDLTAGAISVASDSNLGAVTGALKLGDASLVVTSAATIARGVEVTSTSSVVDTQNNNVTLSGNITGTGILVKEGMGELTLSGTNQQTGGTTIKAGTLSVSSAANLGGENAVLTIDNATLKTTAPMTVTTSVSLVGDANIDTDTNDVAIDSVISGQGTLVKKSTGKLTLTGDNTFSGGVKITGGSISVASDKNLGDSAGIITLDMGTLTTTADFTTSRNITLDTGGGFLDSSGSAAEYKGVISGVGALRAQGTGAIILAGDNTYTGATEVQNTSLRIDGDQSASTGLVTVHGSSTLGGKGTIGGSVSVSATGKLLSFVDTDLTRYALHIKGDLTATNATLEYDYGQDALHNTIAVQVAGNIDLTGSTIDIKASSPMSAGVYHLIDYQGTKQGTDPTLGNVPSGGGYTLRLSQANEIDLVYAGGHVLQFWSPAGNVGVVSGGTGTWEVLGTSNSWTDHDATINGAYTDGSFAVFEGQSGTVTVDNTNGAINVTGMQFATDGYVLTGGEITLDIGDNKISVGDGKAASATNVATIDSELTGVGSLQKTDAGILILGGSNTYLGGTTVTAGTLRVSADDNLGDASGDLAIDTGTLQYAAGFDTNRAISVLNAKSTIDTQNFDASLNGIISGTGGLIKKGSGKLSLLGDNSFTDRTIIQEGTLALAGDGTLAQSAGVTVNGEFSIENISASETSIKDLDGTNTGQVVLGSKNLTITDAQDKEFAGVISGNGQLHLTGGSLTLSGDNSYTGGTAIDAGATLKLGTGGTTGSIGGAIQLDGVLDVAKAGDVNLGNQFSGSGILNLNNSGTTTLAADSPDFAGTTNLNTGQLVVDVVHGGTVNVAVNTILSGTGTVGGLQNYGTIKPGGDDAFGTFTVAGNYEGDQGDVIIKTVLNGDASATDMLKITGDTSGNTNIVVKNRGGLGAQTNQGIHIISIDGKSDGVFRLKGDALTHSGEQAVIAGVYAYTLNEGTSSDQDGNWYLRSELANPPTPTPPGPQPTPQPRYNPAIPLYTVYGQMLDRLNQSMTTSLRDRVGQRFLANGASPAPIEEGSSAAGEQSVIWGRIDMAHGRFKPSGSTTGNHFEQDTWRLTAGVDAELLANEAGEMFGSVWLDYVTDNGRVDSMHGRGKLVTDGYGLGGAVTWYDQSRWYLDAQGHLTWYRTEFDSHDTFASAAERQKALGYGLSAEFGHEFKLDESWSLTPQAQLSYSSVGLDSFVDAYQAAVNLDSKDSLVLRAGLAANYRDQWHNDKGGLEKLDAYVIANVYTQMLSQSQGINISSVRFDAGKTDRTWMEIGAGATHLWADSGIALFGNASFATGVENAGDNYQVSGKVGLKVNW